MPAERTLILFKPDAVQRRLCGELLSRIEQKGLKIVGLKMMRVTPELSKKHYAEHISKPFYPLLESFITAGPVVALAVEGPEAVSVMRTMMLYRSGCVCQVVGIRTGAGRRRRCRPWHSRSAHCRR